MAAHPRKHLFLATGRASYGEPVTGLAMARALHAEGDQVAFLYPSSLHPLFRDVPFPRATLDVAEFDLLRTLRGAIKERGFETLVLIDAALVMLNAGPQVGAAILDELPVRVLGLDFWNLPETNLSWDLGATQWKIDRRALDVPCFRPSPIVRPEADGAYRSLPEIPPISDDERAAVRTEHGISGRQKLVVTATASWQDPSFHKHLDTGRTAEHAPEIYELLLARMPESHLYHVGPAPFRWGVGHPRYRHSKQLPPPEFRRLVAAADAFVSLNLPATSVSAAVAAGTPALVLTNAYQGTTVEQVELAAGHRLADDARRWVEKVLPLYPFRLCPGGLFHFLEPVLARNPYRAALRERELVDLDGAAATLRALCDDGPERAAMKQAQADFREANARLPTMVQVFRQLSAR